MLLSKRKALVFSLPYVEGSGQKLLIDVAYNQKDCRSLSWVNGFLSDTQKITQKVMYGP